MHVSVSGEGTILAFTAALFSFTELLLSLKLHGTYEETLIDN